MTVTTWVAGRAGHPDPHAGRGDGGERRDRLAVVGASPQRPLLEWIPPLLGYGLQTYDHCDLRCVYCITGVQGVSTPRVPPGAVAERLRIELGEREPGTHIVVGALCDAYPRAEAELGVTREALEALVALGQPFRVITKGTTVERDLDLLGAHRRNKLVMSLCAVDDAVLRTVDPAAPAAAARIEVLHRARDAGIKVELSAAPWIPGVTDVEAIVAAVGPDVSVRVTPVRVEDEHVRDTPFGRRHDQREVNAAYVAEHQRVGTRQRLRWSPPPALDGSAPHLISLLGRSELDGRTAHPGGQDGPHRRQRR